MHTIFPSPQECSKDTWSRALASLQKVRLLPKSGNKWLAEGAAVQALHDHMLSALFVTYVTLQATNR